MNAVKRPGYAVRFGAWLMRRWRRHLAWGALFAALTIVALYITYDSRAVGGTRPGTLMFVISRLGTVSALAGWLAIFAGVLGALLSLVAVLAKRRGGPPTPNAS